MIQLINRTRCPVFSLALLGKSGSLHWAVSQLSFQICLLRLLGARSFLSWMPPSPTQESCLMFIFLTQKSFAFPVFQKSTLSIDIFLHGPLLRVHKDHGLETQVWLDLDSETDAKASFMPRAEEKQFKSVLMVCQHLCFRQDYFGLIKTDLIQRYVRIENDWPSSFPGLKYKTLAKTFVNTYFDLLENTVLENSAGNTNNNAVHKSSYH